MGNNYVLDTSALFTYIKAEEGADTVEEILNSAKKGSGHVYLSFVSLMEIYYITWQVKSETAAKEIIVSIKSLPVHLVESNERITLAAGRIKANHKLSVADAFIAATALEKGAVLVHKDPELEVPAKVLQTIKLPYKQARK